jgi:hypothetical protein
VVGRNEEVRKSILNKVVANVGGTRTFCVYNGILASKVRLKGVKYKHAVLRYYYVRLLGWIGKLVICVLLLMYRLAHCHQYAQTIHTI